MLYKVHRK